MKQLIAIIFIAFSCFGGQSQFVLLNEYSLVESADAEGWIELHNPTDEAYYLENWKVRFVKEGIVMALEPLLIEGGAYEVVPITDQSLRHSASIHAYVSQSTTQVELVNSTDEVISSLYWVCIPETMSYGRSASFPSQAHFLVPTPGEENSTDVHVFQEEVIELSHPSGFYSHAQLQLTNSSNDNLAFHYTLLGASPNATSTEWPSSGLELTSANSNETELSFIEASGQYIVPSGPQETAHTVAIQAYEHGCPVSPIERRVYFVGDSEFSALDVPIVSITTNDDDLFEDDGIYSYGSTGVNFAYKGRFWERQATVAYFDESKQLKLEQNVGIRIRGNSSRYAPQKSFKLFARDEYDSADDFENVFFDENVQKFERLNLRTPHTDFISSMLTDHYAMQLVQDLNIDAPNSKTTLLFLNGEFWGVYSLQESMDEHYPESHYDIDDDDVVVFDDEVPALYQEVIDFAQNNDLTLGTNFNWVNERVDIASMIDYYAAQLFFANWDWPIKNVKLWYSDIENTPIRFYFFDCDACFNEFEQESIDRFYPDLASEDHSILFSKLMQNEVFRTQFITRMIELMGTDFAVDNLLEKLDETIEKMTPLVDYQISRWGFPQSRSAWEQNVESLRFFLLTRHFEMIEQIKELNANQLLVYPNPAMANSHIQIQSFGYLTGQFNFEIHDQTGRSVQWGTSQGEGIQLDYLSPGMYVLRLEKNGFLATTRFTIVG